jgi:hypothetical protein
MIEGPYTTISVMEWNRMQDVVKAAEAYRNGRGSENWDRLLNALDALNVQEPEGSD